ncbi:MAG: pectate lyase [Verrucomicrobiaceae bacterium]|nr:pectate lyase [Verrucomicrobiaceae bacterium]
MSGAAVVGVPASAGHAAQSPGSLSPRDSRIGNQERPNRLKAGLQRVATALIILLLLHAAQLTHAQQPSCDEVTRALTKAAAFFHDHVSIHGGYVYAFSGDLQKREGEGVTDEHTIWVQPPGTPLVGEAMLDVFEATKDAKILGYAKEAALALAQRQLQSGGWHYGAHFETVSEKKDFHRFDLDWKPVPDRVPENERAISVGWDVWKRRTFEANLTILDDDTTQSALRFLVRIDKVLNFAEPRIHDAALFGLKSLAQAQYPNGAWSASYDRFPDQSPSNDGFPVKKASYPDDWPRKWPKDFTGCYVINDDLVADAMHTMLRAHEVYGDARYLECAKKAGRFFLLAQMPDPQPAWAQQYDRDMHPVWSRAFEPSAISSRESETVMEALMMLARATGDKSWLAPIPKALAYLRKSLLPDGKLARFYELKTNQPIYFQRKKGGGDEMTYSNARPADHYGFIIDPILDEIEAEHRRLSAMPKPAGERPIKETPAELSKAAREIIASMDERGAWVQHGVKMKHNKGVPPSGVIFSEVFAKNVAKLCNSIGVGHRPPLSQ